MAWTIRYVGMYNPDEHLYRLCRVIGTRGTVGDGKGFSWKFSLGFQWAFPMFLRIRLHRAYGGRYT